MSKDHPSFIKINCLQFFNPLRRNALENLEKARDIISETSAIEEVDREIKVVKVYQYTNSIF